MRRFSDLDEAAEALAERIVELGERSLAAHGSYRLAVSGGSSPVPMFRHLVQDHRTSLAWRSVDLYWVDERAVAPTSPESNYGLAERELLGPLGAERPRAHRIEGERVPIEAAAEAYAKVLAERTATASDPSGALLDLAVLGLGPDGHTASLFPGSKLLDPQRSELVAVEPQPGRPPLVPRVTLTLPALARTKSVAFLVGGAEKRAALRSVLQPTPGTPIPPAGLVRAIGPVEWFVDRVAAPDAGP